MAQEFHQQPAHSDRLIVVDNQGNKSELTLTKLEAWFASVEKQISPSPVIIKQEKNAPLANLFVSRFGLQNTADVLNYLKSPDGKTTVALIEEELAIEAAQQEDQEFALREEQARHRRMLAFLLMGLLYSKSAKAKKLYEQIQEQIDKFIQELDDKTMADKKLMEESHIKNYDIYQEASSVLAERLDTQFLESEKLQKELENWDKQNQALDSKYSAYHEHLDSLHKDLSHYGDLSDETVTQAISIEDIQNRIDKLSEQLRHDADKVHGLLESENEADHDAARELLNQSNARNMQIATLKDMLSVVKKENYLVKEDGSKAKNFDEANFILPATKKLVKDGDQYFLINSNNDWNTIKNDPALRNEAAKAFKEANSSHSLMSVKNLVSHNQKAEKKEHTNTKTQLTARSEKLQQEIDLLAKQLTAIQSAKAQISEAMRQETEQLAAPKLTPVPSTPKPAAVQSKTVTNDNYQANTYKHLLMLMKYGPSNNGIKRLDDAFRARSGMTEASNQINALPRGAPIPPLVMQNLLKYIERFGIDATKPNVAGNLNPSDKKPSSTAPTPFNMTPKWGG